MIRWPPSILCCDAQEKHWREHSELRPLARRCSVNLQPRRLSGSFALPLNNTSVQGNGATARCVVRNLNRWATTGEAPTSMAANKTLLLLCEFRVSRTAPFRAILEDWAPYSARDGSRCRKLPNRRSDRVL